MKLTKANLITFIMIVTISFTYNVFSQLTIPLQIENTSKLINTDSRLFCNKQSLSTFKRDKISYPIYDIHIAAGVANGFRIGGRIKIKHFSFETAYGVSFDVITGNGKTTYTFGANWHPLEEHWYFMSFMFTYLRDPIHTENYGEVFSINAGAITFDTSKISAFLRVGAFAYFKTSRNGLNKETFFYPNIDLGIGYRFSL